MGDELPSTLAEGGAASEPSDSPGPVSSATPRADGFELVRGTAVDRYFVLEPLGAGGMGVVYAAYDPKLDRRVAIKLLREHATEPALASEGRTRLVFEAQAMAKLSHPNVVTVHDVGTWGERVYIAMEFVEGQTLRAWLLAQPRSWREILHMMIRAGRGLAAAHAAGLVHRDFKPDNVMIAADGHGTGRVRVMDFGLARISTTRSAQDGDGKIGASGPAASPTNETECTAAGTPAYMAPEQLRREQADALSDQFAFGVSLWEALVGQRPFVGGSLTELAANVADGRIVAPPKRVEVPDDVLRVAARAFAVGRADRFATMDALLDALARDPTRRRRRIAVAAGIAALAVGVFAVQRFVNARKVAACQREGVAIAEVWGETTRAPLSAAILATATPYATATLERLEPWLDRYAAEWSALKTEACLESAFETSLSPQLLEAKHECLDEKRLALAKAIEMLLRADADAARNAVRVASGLPRLAQCDDEAALVRRLPPPDDEHSQAVIAEVKERIAEVRVLNDAGRYREGLERAEATLSRARELDWVPLVARAEFSVGLLANAAGDQARAQTALRSAFFLAGGVGVDETAANAATVMAWVVGVELKDEERGLEWAELAAMSLRRLGGPESLYTASLSSTLGSIDSERGAFESAVGHHESTLRIREEILGPDHPDVARALTNLGSAYERTGRLQEARASLERARDLWEHSLGPDHPLLAAAWGNLGQLHQTEGDLDSALAAYRRSLEIAEHALGPYHTDVARAAYAISGVAFARGDFDGAVETLHRARAIYERELGADHPKVVECSALLGSLAFDRGNFVTAIEQYERALAGQEHRGETPELAANRFALARALWEGGGDRVRAAALAGRAREFYRINGEAHAAELERVIGWLADHAS